MIREKPQVENIWAEPGVSVNKFDRLPKSVDYYTGW